MYKTAKILAVGIFLFSPSIFGNDAEKEIRQILLQNPAPGSEQFLKISFLYRKQAQFYIQNKDYLRSAICLRKARSFDPEFPELDFEIGNSYFLAGRLPAAKVFLSRFLEDSPDSEKKPQAQEFLQRILVSLAEEYARISLWNQAIEYYQDALKYSSSTQRSVEILDKVNHAYFLQGSFHYSQKHFLQAAEFFMKALSKNTKSDLKNKIEKIGTHLFMSTAKHYEKIGRSDLAISYYTAIRDHFHNETAIQYAKQRLLNLNEKSTDSSVMPEWLETSTSESTHEHTNEEFQ